MDSGMLSLVEDYGGLAIGLALLIAGVWVLPSRIKWYVLTAGLAIIGYEAYLRMSNRKLMDREREKLRTRLAELDQRDADLGKTVAQLNQKLTHNRAMQAALHQQASEFAKRGEDVSSQKKQLDQESESLTREIDSHLQRQEQFESKLQDAQHALEQMR